MSSATLLETIKQADQRQYADAQAEYKAIIYRTDEPNPDDAVRLRSCMSILGLSIGDVQSDMDALAELRELERWDIEDADRDITEATELHSKKNKEYEEAQKQLEEVRQRALRLQGEAPNAYFAIQRLKDKRSSARSRSIEIQQQHSRIF